MKIAVIDADLVSNSKHRFPNLCCMKISSYHKSLNDDVVLKTDYENLEEFDKVYISKVFVKTRIPFEPDNQEDKNEFNVIEWYKDNPLLKQDNIEYGGTGFFYDKAPPLPCEIEHSMPDYHLYDEWVDGKIKAGANKKDFKFYREYSIGFLTRKCFRKCYYCVNRNYSKVETAGNFSEFYNQSRAKIVLLDDNFFGHPDWEELIKPVVATNKPFQFRQGLDERLLTEYKIDQLSKWRYDREITFAFDNIEDKEVIEEKLKLIRANKALIKPIKFYVFCGCDKNGVYDDNFWHKDISEVFERLEILNRYKVDAYIMRYEKVYQTEYSSFYAALAAWVNQPAMYHTFPFDLFCRCKGMKRGAYEKYKRDTDGYLADGNPKGAPWRALDFVSEKFPDINARYFKMIGFQKG